MWIMCSIREKSDKETRRHGDKETRRSARESEPSKFLLVSWSPCLLVCILAGCSTQQKIVYSPVNTTPIIGDEAIALRSDWPKSYSHYANGGVSAYSTRFPYDVNIGHPVAGTVVLEPALFIAQVAFLPVSLAANPPFEEQVWHGEVLPPT